MLNRPYIRIAVRQEVENRAEKNEKGQFLDANTHQPIEGKYDLGHKAGHEFRTEVRKAEEENLTQAEFNERMNNPNLYQIEDPSNNRSHQFEAKAEDTQTATVDEDSSATQNTTATHEDNTASSTPATTSEVTAASSSSSCEDSTSSNNSDEDCDTL